MKIAYRQLVPGGEGVIDLYQVLIGIGAGLGKAQQLVAEVWRWKEL